MRAATKLRVADCAADGVRLAISQPAEFSAWAKDGAFDCLQDLPGLDTIAQAVFAALSGAIGAAKYFRAILHAVSDDFAPAMIAFWRDHVDRTLEAIEDVRFALERDLKRLVVVVPAMFTPSHEFLFLSYISFSLGH
jgi:hypothetical protein